MGKTTIAMMVACFFTTHMAETNERRKRNAAYLRGLRHAEL